ncbi:tigger transposable element-derived protein 1-like protein [Lasius niger]|uniref:Tigger transposable element-derived protein 1-like protein n=1 Tax=Lasius niger TaxID=67767 RepID=A0A0J7JUW4_LASNI|nr:tigger transposable element-derived protein 1-like protein [Lasius niger]
MVSDMREVDPNIDRSSKFAKGLQSSFTAYDQLLKVTNLKQKGIKNFFKKVQTRASDDTQQSMNLSNENSAPEIFPDNEIISDDDEVEGTEVNQQSDRGRFRRRVWWF